MIGGLGRGEVQGLEFRPWYLVLILLFGAILCSGSTWVWNKDLREWKRVELRYLVLGLLSSLVSVTRNKKPFANTSQKRVQKMYNTNTSIL